jgi:hypothetical protein
MSFGKSSFPFNINDIEPTGDTMLNSTTLKLVLTNVEDGRVRATIESPDGGVYAEKADAQSAAGQAVKTYLALYPLAAPAKASLALRPQTTPPAPWLHSRSVIKQLLYSAVDNGGKVRIAYEDSVGHETTRTIAPSVVRPNGTVVAYDDLRDSIRSFRIEGIQALQEVV